MKQARVVNPPPYNESFTNMKNIRKSEDKAQNMVASHHGNH